MNEFEVTVLSDLAALKSQMAALLGMGQPGRLTLLEERLERHEVYVQRMRGVAGAIFALMTVVQLTIDAFRR
jgi:predicted nicotinamide N-methyase